MPSVASTLLVAGLLAIASSCSGQHTSPLIDSTPAAPPQLHALSIATQPSSAAPSGAAFPQQPVIQLRDEDNQPLRQSGVVVRAAIAAGGDALVGSTTATTDANGAAAFANLAIGGTIGARTLRFSAASLAVVSNEIVITPGPATTLVIAVPPSTSAPSGSPFAQQPAIQLADAWNNAVLMAGVAITASVASGGGALAGVADRITNGSGIAAYAGLAIAGSGPQTLQFSAPGLTAATSSPITITGVSGGDTTKAPTLLVSEGFDDANFAARGWYDLTPGLAPTISTAEHAPGSGSSLAMTFPSGATTPTPNVVARHLFTPGDAVYVRLWIKHSANWVGSGQPYHPHEFYFMTTEDDAYVGPSSTHLTAYVEENAQGDGGYAFLQVQDARNIDVARIRQDLTGVTEQRAVSGCNGSPDDTPTDCYSSGGAWFNDKGWRSAQPVFLDASGPGYKGDWHKVEAYFKLNSIANGIGQRDGIAQYWIDGALVIDRRDLMLRTGAHPTMLFNQVLIAPYIGDGSPVTQTLWLDDLVVMSMRPAP